MLFSIDLKMFIKLRKSMRLQLFHWTGLFKIVYRSIITNVDPTATAATNETTALVGVI